MSEGRKDDQAKVRLDLIPPEAVFALGDILTYGARKYTRYEDLNSIEELQGWLHAKVWNARPLDVIRIDVSIRSASAANATNATCVAPIRTSQSDSVKIAGTGSGETQSEFASSPSSARNVHKPEPETAPTSGASSFGSAASTNGGLQKSVNTSGTTAGSASDHWTRSALCISITITRADGREDSFAVDATTASACLAKALTCFGEPWNISALPRPGDLSVTPSGIRVVAHQGERNWELGMKWGRVFGAAMRHLWSWWGGCGPTSKNFAFGEVDDETKRSHLWHALCCVVFLVTYEERGIGEDDRPART